MQTQPGVVSPPGPHPPSTPHCLFSLPLPSLYSLPPVVPTEGMVQAGEGGPGRSVPGHVEDSEDGEAPPRPSVLLLHTQPHWIPSTREIGFAGGWKGVEWGAPSLRRRAEGG